MPRNISFALTTEQFRARTKTVTRRVGWRNLSTGEILCGVVKSQGLKRGEKIERLGLIEVVGLRFELLRRLTDDFDYGIAETCREGFARGPLSRPSAFVEFFCRSHSGVTPESTITRIEFTYT